MNRRKEMSKRLGKNVIFCVCLAAMAIFLAPPVVFAMGGGGGGGGSAAGGVGSLGAMTSYGYGNMAIISISRTHFRDWLKCH